MPTTYLRFVYSTPESPAFRYDFDEPEEQSILLFDPVAEATKSDLGSLFGQVYPHFKTSDLIIIRGAGPEFIDLMKDRGLQEQIAGKRVVALVSLARKPALNSGEPRQPVLSRFPHEFCGFRRVTPHCHRYRLGCKFSCQKH